MFKREILRIGTRRSPLALRQTEMVVRQLSDSCPVIASGDCNIEVVEIQTSGDMNQQGSLADIGGKGLFAKEIESALLAGDIDIAVHSMKDMETVLPDGLSICAMLRREDVRDVLIIRKDAYDASAGVLPLKKGAVIGTSSVRRKAQLKGMRPDVEIVDFRGNVGTRLQKLRDGIADATMLAYAGIKRLGLRNEIEDEFNLKVMPVDDMLPAASQGAIGVECRDGSSDRDIVQLLSTISHVKSFIAVTAERAALNRLDGSCRTPIAAYADFDSDGRQLGISLELYSADGSRRYFARHAIAVAIAGAGDICLSSYGDKSSYAAAMEVARTLGIMAAGDILEQTGGTICL